MISRIEYYRVLDAGDDVPGRINATGAGCAGAAKSSGSRTMWVVPSRYGVYMSETLAIPALLWDERFSTNAVNRGMLAADLSRAKRREKKDALAAVFILQGVLDALS